MLAYYFFVFFFFITSTFRIIDTSNQQWAVLVHKIHSRCRRVPSAAERSTSPRRVWATMGMGMTKAGTVKEERGLARKSRLMEKTAWRERRGSRPPRDQRSGGKPGTTGGSLDAIEDGRSIGPVWRSVGRGAAGGLHSVR